MARYLGLLIVGIIFGMFGVMIHWNALMFGDLFQVFLRNSIALVVLFPILFWRHISFKLSKFEWSWLFFYSVVSVFGFVLVTLAYLETEIKTVLAVRYFTSVIFSLLISSFIFKEIVTRINITAMILVLLGISVFAYPYENFLTIGVLYSVLTAIAFLILGMIIKKVELRPEVLMSAEYSVVAVLVGLFVVVSGVPTLVDYSTLSLVSVLIFGLLLIVVTYLIIYGYRKTNFNLANIILTSEIFFGILFGFIFLKQTITLTQTIGIVLIFIAVVLPNVVGYFIQKVVQE